MNVNEFEVCYTAQVCEKGYGRGMVVIMDSENVSELFIIGLTSVLLAIGNEI